MINKVVRTETGPGWRQRLGLDLDSYLLLVCEPHHRAVHKGRWQLRLDPSGFATWTSPGGSAWWCPATWDRLVEPEDLTDAELGDDWIRPWWEPTGELQPDHRHRRHRCDGEGMAGGLPVLMRHSGASSTWTAAVVPSAWVTVIEKSPHVLRAASRRHVPAVPDSYGTAAPAAETSYSVAPDAESSRVWPQTRSSGARADVHVGACQGGEGEHGEDRTWLAFAWPSQRP